MLSRPGERGPVTFIVRLTPGAGDTLQGVVERVLTGEKSRFDGLDRLCAILAEAVSRERGRANPGSPG
jgi:hypothetical protein